jgi:hypothetical protein
VLFILDIYVFIFYVSIYTIHFFKGRWTKAYFFAIIYPYMIDTVRYPSIHISFNPQRSSEDKRDGAFSTVSFFIRRFS